MFGKIVLLENSIFNEYEKENIRFLSDLII